MRRYLPGILGFVIGCGSASVKTVPVTGTLLKDGKPFTFSAQNLPPGDSGFRLEFLKQEESGKEGELFAAEFKPQDGTFAVKAPDRNGIPVGNYKVIVEKGARGLPDEFKNAFSKVKTPLTLAIPDANGVKVEIDLDKKSATAK